MRDADMVPCTKPSCARAPHSGSCSQPQIRELGEGVVTQTTALRERDRLSLAYIPLRQCPSHRLVRLDAKRSDGHYIYRLQ